MKGTIKLINSLLGICVRYFLRLMTLLTWCGSPWGKWHEARGGVTQSRWAVLSSALLSPHSAHYSAGLSVGCEHSRSEHSEHKNVWEDVTCENRKHNLTKGSKAIYWSYNVNPHLQSSSDFLVIIKVKFHFVIFILLTPDNPD